MTIDEHITTIRGERNRKSQRAALIAVARDLGVDVEGLPEKDAADWKRLMARWADEGRSVHNIRYRAQTAHRYLRSVLGGEIDPEVERVLRLRGLKTGSKSGTGRMLMPGEINRLIGLPLTSRANRLAYACFWTQTCLGLRRSELVAMKLHDYDTEREQLRVRDAKTLEERWLWMPEPVRMAIAIHRTDIKHESDYILQGARRQRLSPDRVNQLYEMMAAACGVARFTSHDLRRTCASTLLDRGVDSMTVSKILGHRNVNTTRLYDRRPHHAQDRAQRLLVDALVKKSPEVLARIHRQLLTTEREGRL